MYTGGLLFSHKQCVYITCARDCLLMVYIVLKFSKNLLKILMPKKFKIPVHIKVFVLFWILSCVLSHADMAECSCCFPTYRSRNK